ncbi:unnamed protein product [Effrenium voratum]|nr:unnamed protein product [Effrenium voratum]
MSEFDLGAEYDRELFVISVIGIQSSAKSTLMNFLFGCGFATSAGRCTRGLYCSLMECDGRTLLILDTEGLMSLEAEGGGVFDAQLALMAMACSHLVIINHKGELSRQLQDLLEVCLFAMQHLKVCRIQPKLLFVLRDQHDRSQGVHGDALRLMRKHLAEASMSLSLRLEELISLDPGSVFLLPSAFASDLEPHTGREVRWSTELFAQEALKLRRKIFKEAENHSCGEAPEFSTLPDWCLHAMSVWRVLDRYGPNLLHYKTIQEIEMQRELEESAKQISAQLVRGKGGLAEECQALLATFKKRLSEESGDKVDSEFRSSLQAILESFDKRAKAELERTLKARRSKLPEAQKEEAKKKLSTPIEYQGELTRYTWSLCLADAVDRDQLRALKVHFKNTIEQLWQAEASQSIAEQQARELFQNEWEAFEEECRGRFARTSKNKRQLAEEVCMVFNHVLRQHRHGDEALHVLELVPAAVLLKTEPFLELQPEKVAEYLELRNAARLRDFVSAQRTEKGHAPRNASESDMLCSFVVPELQRRLATVLNMEVDTQMPSEEKVLDAMQRLNDALEAGAMNNDDEELEAQRVLPGRGLAAYQASLNANKDAGQVTEQKSGAFERMKGDDPNWRVKTSEGQATLADIKKRRRDELEEAQEEGVSRKFKIQNFTSEDSAVVGEKTIVSHYCSICGEHCVAADVKLLKLPRRKTDRSFALEEAAYFHKKYANFGERILLKRANGVEKQFRFYCRQCRQPLGYRPRPESETSKFSYFYHDALVEEQSGHRRPELQLPARWENVGLGLRLRGGRVALLNTLQLGLRQRVLAKLLEAEARGGNGYRDRT